MVFRNLFQCLQQHCIELLKAWNCVRIVLIYKVQIFQRSGVLLLVAVVFQIVGGGGLEPSLFCWSAVWLSLFCGESINEKKVL